MRTATLPLLGALLLPLVAGTPALRAQQVHTQQVAVGATVPVRSPTVVGTRDLAFGVITPDTDTPTSVTVLPSVDPEGGGAQSGVYRFDVTATHGLAFSVAAPTELTSDPLPALPLTFSGSEYGGWCVTADESACALTAFDPDAGDQRVCAGELGDGSCDLGSSWPAESILSVFIGGEVTIPPTARAGTYAAMITLTITQVY